MSSLGPVVVEAQADDGNRVQAAYACGMHCLRTVIVNQRVIRSDILTASIMTAKHAHY